MFSFQALLSTGLSRGYSQGLIHRKSFSRPRKCRAGRKFALGSRGFFKKGRRQTGANGLSADNEGRYLPMQKLEKIRPNKSSELKAPVISPRDCCAWRRSSASNSPAPAKVN